MRFSTSKVFWRHHKIFERKVKFHQHWYVLVEFMAHDNYAELWLHICSIKMSINYEILHCATCFQVTLQLLMQSKVTLGKVSYVTWLRSLDSVKDLNSFYTQTEVNKNFTIRASRTSFCSTPVHTTRYTSSINVSSFCWWNVFSHLSLNHQFFFVSFSFLTLSFHANIYNTPVRKVYESFPSFSKNVWFWPLLLRIWLHSKYLSLFLFNFPQFLWKQLGVLSLCLEYSTTKFWCVKGDETNHRPGPV